MSQNYEAVKLNLLVLEEAQKDKEKKQAEGIYVEEPVVSSKTVKIRGRRKINVINEESSKVENNIVLDSKEDIIPISDNNNDTTPIMLIKNQTPVNNKKMADIFKVDTPAKQTNQYIEPEPNEKNKLNDENFKNEENKEITQIEAEDMQLPQENQEMAVNLVNIEIQEVDNKNDQIKNVLENEEDFHSYKNEEDEYSEENLNNLLDDEDEDFDIKNEYKKNKRRIKTPTLPKMNKKQKETKNNKGDKQKYINSNLTEGIASSNLENEIEQCNEYFDSIIDLEQINSQIEISNSNMILAIIEICINSKKYGINKENKTREFWKQVYEKSEWNNIFKKFQSETLRKYWRIIRDVDNIFKFIEAVNNYADKLNGNNIKYYIYLLLRLLPVINTISSFINSKAKSFDMYEKQLTSPQNLSVTTKEKIKMSDPLNKKRSREDAIFEDIKEIKMKILETDKKKNSSTKEEGKDEDLANKNPSEIQNDGAINKRKKKTDKKFQNEEESLKDIKEIIYDLSISFDGKTNDEILDIFKNTSFNVQNAYLYLTDPEYFRGISLFNYLELGYSEPDDKIIKTFEKSSVYAKLMELKGKERMFERKGFSKIK